MCVARLQGRYKDETFVHVLPKGVVPHTRHVRGSTHNLIGVFPDRLPGRAIVISGARGCDWPAWCLYTWQAGLHASSICATGTGAMPAWLALLQGQCR